MIKKRFLTFFMIIFIISLKSSPADAYSLDIQYLSLFESAVIEKDWTEKIFGPYSVKDKLECLSKCNRNDTCRVISVVNNVCTLYKINNWNFTVSNIKDSTTYVKIENDEPMVRTYEYYSMVVLCKCFLRK